MARHVEEGCTRQEKLILGGVCGRVWQACVGPAADTLFPYRFSLNTLSEGLRGMMMQGCTTVGRQAVGAGSRQLGGYGVDFTLRVVIITTMNSKQIIKQLEADGWTLRSVRGSHHVFTHPVKRGHISVPHPKQELGVGLVNKLLKQAGLK